MLTLLHVDHASIGLYRRVNRAAKYKMHNQWGLYPVGT